MMARLQISTAVFMLLFIHSVHCSVTITAGGQFEDMPGSIDVQNFIPDAKANTCCKIEMITQVVTHPNCDTQVIEAQVCVGQCLSYSYPKTEPGNQTASYFCESCQASSSHWKNLTMNCSDDYHQYTVNKQIHHIEACSCSECPVKTVSPSDESFSFPSEENVEFSFSRNSSSEDAEASQHHREVDGSLGSQQGVSREGEHSGNDLRGPVYRGGEVVKSPSDILEEEEVVFNPKGERDPNLDRIAGSHNSSVPDFVDFMNLLSNVNHSVYSIAEIKDIVKANSTNNTLTSEVSSGHGSGDKIDEELEEGLSLPIDEVEDPLE